ncbi:unnamed protein product [Bursaphelenchus okinawaensis]|uniref:DNA repair and recombination protein RAD54-like n=2 Tax=Bursaphelenchus okinawaensis TaxID=465554 RepID=A0A811KWZ2_9BILA|nr:unnamed protein product [Bursaphelenchus okinawaensis]CAG9114746.1 unnamed protein product [Bursaphelenchus okinawaensis]
MKRSAAPTSRVNQPYKRPSILTDQNQQTQSQSPKSSHIRKPVEMSRSQDEGSVLEHDDIVPCGLKADEREPTQVVQFKPSSTDFKADGGKLGPSVTNIGPSSTNFDRDLKSGASFNAVNHNFGPSSTNVRSTGTNFRPAGLDFKPSGSVRLDGDEDRSYHGQYKPKVNQDDQFEPATTQHKPTSSKLKPNTAHYKVTTSQLKPNTSQLKPTTSQLEPIAPQLNQISQFQTQPQNTKTRRFTVVYAKHSTKKHKHWEGDGILEVNDNKMYLKSDKHGHPTIGTASAKDLHIMPNTRLHVGSYELEVQEEIKEKQCVQFLIFCPLTDLQQLLYTSILDLMTLGTAQMIDFLLKLCNHPVLLLARLQQYLESEQKNVAFEVLNEAFPPTCSTDDIHVMDCNKLKTLFEMVVSFDENDEKSIIVANSKSVLDLIQALFEEALFEVLRLDSASPSERKELIQKFNQPNLFDHPNQVLLTSQKTTTMGLDLSGATRLIMYDSDWTRNDDIIESLAWRHGQSEECRVYRLITAGTIEEKMLQRQQTLPVNALNVTSPTEFDEEELDELLKFSPDSKSDTHTKLKCRCKEDGNGQNENGSASPETQASNSMLNRAMGETQIRRSLEPKGQIEEGKNELLNWRHFSINESTTPAIQSLTGFSETTLDSVSFIMVKEPESTEKHADITLF